MDLFKESLGSLREWDGSGKHFACISSHRKLLGDYSTVLRLGEGNKKKKKLAVQSTVYKYKSMLIIDVLSQMNVICTILHVFVFILFQSELCVKPLPDSPQMTRNFHQFRSIFFCFNCSQLCRKKGAEVNI
jgi:hypothetical protein